MDFLKSAALILLLESTLVNAAFAACAKLIFWLSDGVLYAQGFALGLFGGQGGHIDRELAKNPLIGCESMVVELHVLHNTGLTDEDLDLVHTNDLVLAFLHGCVQQLFEESSLTFSTAKLKGCLNASVV